MLLPREILEEDILGAGRKRGQKTFLGVTRAKRDSLFATELQKLVMGTAFHNATLTDEVDLVTLLNRAESVGNGYGGPPLCSTVKSILNDTLAVTVQCRSRFVK